LLALHQLWSGRGLRGAGTPAGRERVVDDVTVLEDRGELIARENPFDLDRASLRLTPRGGEGYDVARLALPLEGGGETLALADDDARALQLPFAFPFFGRSETRVFVHSDGNLTFEAPDVSTDDRGLGRLLSGPPRIAPLFSDLAPDRGGTVSARLAPDRAVFAWLDVPGGTASDPSSFSVTLHLDGAIDFVYGGIGAREAVVGVSPGASESFTAADLSAAEPRGAPGALAESFSDHAHLDLVAAVRRFLRSQPDAFDQLVVYTTRPLNPIGESLAFEVNVRNDITGIGLAPRDDSRDWGSAGALASVVYMDAVDSYLDVDGFEILGHEVGHRWLASLRFRAGTGAVSGALLGRGGVHWSFFLDSAASVLEGNAIADLGAGRFETADIVRGFSALDQYAMGLRAASELPPFFFVAGADDFQPNRSYTSISGPELGVSFTGTRQDVTIGDVVAAMGPRVPNAASAPRRLRQAYILVADAGAPASDVRLAAVARIRARFEAWYSAATDGRGWVSTTLP
jgi:hypothetical protein